MSFSVKYEVTALLMLSLATLVWTTSVHAQSQTAIAMPAQTDSPDPADPGWHIDVVPYLWFPGINGTVGALGQEAGVSVTARNVLSYFDFGLMGAVEIRYNRIIIPVDFMERRTGSMPWRAPDSSGSLRRKPCSQSRETPAAVDRNWTTR